MFIHMCCTCRDCNTPSHRTALECAKRVQLPVMAHHSMSTVKLGGEEEVLSCPGRYVCVCVCVRARVCMCVRV